MAASDALGVFPNRTRRDLLKLAGVAALAPAALGGCGTDDTVVPPLTYAATITDARDAIAQAMAASDTPAVSVALIDRDRVAWAEAFGVIDKATRAGATPETLFCIGSCSKVVATVAVMLLVERGQVDLDAPLVRYLPQFTMASPEHVRITVRMLVNHSSGLPGCDYRGLFAAEPDPDYAAQVLRSLAPARLKHAPGEMSVYCNDGFTLVEPLVTAITGRTYPQFVADEILGPLAMLRSRFAQAPFAEGTYAPGYDGEDRLPQEFTLAHASGGLYTTPTDMGRLARMLMNGGQIDDRRFLRAASVAEMGRNQTLAEPLQPIALGDGFGLGWDGVKSDALAPSGVIAWHKSGGTDVYTSDFFVAPDEGLAVMITGSSTAYGAGALAERILLSALVERRRIAELPGPVPAVPGPEGSASDDEIAALEGVYANYKGLVRAQAGPNRTLTFSSYAGGAWGPSVAGHKRRADGFFSSDANPLFSYRGAGAAGERYLVMRFPYGMGHYLWEIPYAQKIPPRAPLSAAWQARLGRRWLVANEPAASSTFREYSPFATLTAVPELPGYVLASAGPLDGKHDQIADASGSDAVARMCLRIPLAFSRDLDDVVIESRGGEEWLRLGSTLFRPAQSVPALGSGTTPVPIGAEGLAEWRGVPVASRLSTAGAAAWKLFDADLNLLAANRGDVHEFGAPAGAQLLLYGQAGTAITVTLG